MSEKTVNKDAIYYMNKLIGLGLEAKRLQDECFEKTGVKLCGLGAKYHDFDNVFYLQTADSIDKLGLPVYRDKAGHKYTAINGYRIIEV